MSGCWENCGRKSQRNGQIAFINRMIIVWGDLDVGISKPRFSLSKTATTSITIFSIVCILIDYVGTYKNGLVNI